MTVAQFLVRFPEYDVPGEPTAEALISAKLAEAANRVSAGVFGSRHADALGYLTAHLLSQSPLGQQARLDATGITTYWSEFQALVRLMAAGPLTT